jgi:hypothetical protein
MPRDLASASVVTSIASAAATTNIFIFTVTSGFAFIQVQTIVGLRRSLDRERLGTGARD